MKITVYGTGYVGLVTGACFADVGNDVLCVDINEQRIAELKNNNIPIYEPGLETIVQRNSEAGRLRFSDDYEEGVQHGLFQFIAVPTPSQEDGSTDMQYVMSAVERIAELMHEYKIIVNKSTVPVGTAERVKHKVGQLIAARGGKIDFDVVSNPEFLKEGAAIQDFTKPDRIIVGTDNVRTAELLKVLYSPYNRNHDRFICMDLPSAELTKYAANAMLATKISFINELANIAEQTGADIENVRIGIGSDARIGYHFIYPGAGYGGSCFPKDVKGLIATSKAHGYQPELLQSVENVNQRQKNVILEKLNHYYDNELAGKTFALWGLSFKPNTDDMREAPSRVVIDELIARGARVKAYDPKAMAEAQRIYSDISALQLCETPEETLDGADALIVMTEWRVFQSPDFALIKAKLKEAVIFDGRNIYEPELLNSLGFSYFGVGRGDKPMHGIEQTTKRVMGVAV